MKIAEQLASLRAIVIPLAASCLALTSMAQPMRLASSAESLVDPKAATFVMGNLEFVVLHELSHLIIGDFNVPIIGPEEYAADYIAAMVLIQAKMFDPQRAVRAREFVRATADAFALSWQVDPKTAVDVRYWDTHALDIQRFYQIACLLYGSDPAAFPTLPARIGMPPSRADRCRHDHDKAHRGIEWLLSSFGRQPEEPEGAAIHIVYDSPPSRVAAEIVTQLRRIELLENTVRRLRDRFALSEEATIVVRKCGRVAEAAWMPETRELVVCYGLIDTFYLLSKRIGKRNVPTISE